MIFLKDILPIELLNAHMEEGVIRRQVHPRFPSLFIYNYTERAQFERIWDAATSVCRGLIVDGDVVIARGFNKFHNLNTDYVPETHEANLPKEAPLVTMKLDGSLGILYFFTDVWRMATRGSFDSDQARWAGEWYDKHAAANGAHWPDLVTPVFEIIYSANRIVVDYDFEGLVLLGMMDNETGMELPREEVEFWGRMNKLRVVERFNKSLAECSAEDNSNEEGYVLTYSNGVKVKVKFGEYVRLHRILTGLNPKAIWELLVKKQEASVQSWLEDAKMPLSFKTWLGGWVTELQARYNELEVGAKEVFAQKPEGTRKELAMYFLNSPNLKQILFLMLDGRDYTGAIWDKIKPKATDTFKIEGE